jgi:hypothetical protein
MTDRNRAQEEWAEMAAQMNEALSSSVERNVEAQAAFVEAWGDALDDSVPEEDVLADGMEGYARAYEVWMDAAEQLAEKAATTAEGEDVDPREFRDVWLQSANEAFSEVMSTEAFAAANGQFVDAMLEMQGEFDEAAQESLAGMGLPTREDVVEVGERLVELERRQHEIEGKLDRVLDALED